MIEYICIKLTYISIAKNIIIFDWIFFFFANIFLSQSNEDIMRLQLENN